MAYQTSLENLLENNTKEHFVIGVPYWYPICPLHPAHARIYVIADVISKFIKFFYPSIKNVFVPIGSHYSGSTAVEWADLIKRGLSCEKNEKIERVMNLMRRYSVDDNDLLNFTNPLNILNYFSDRIITNLREMGVEVDERAYNTLDPSYINFVKIFFDELKNKGFLIIKGDDLSIDYSKLKWLASSQEEKTGIITTSHINLLKEGILGNIHNFRKRPDFFVSIFQPKGSNGYITLSVPYQNIPLDPMHDSLLYDVFNSERFGFNLPVDLFLAEEHLKTWLARRLMAETIYLTPEQRTLAYFILGNGKLNHKHMSSSSGNAVFVQDLCREFDPVSTRLFLLLIGDPRRDFDLNSEDYKNKLRSIQKGIGTLFNILETYKNKQNFPNETPIVKNWISSEINALKSYFSSGELNKAAEYFLYILPKKVVQVNYRTPSLDTFLRKLTYVFLGKGVEI